MCPLNKVTRHRETSVSCVADLFPLNNKITRQGETSVSGVDTNLGCIAVRKGQDEVMGIGELSCLLYFFLSQHDCLSELAGKREKSCSTALRAVNCSTLHFTAIYHSS